MVWEGARTHGAHHTHMLAKHHTSTNQQLLRLLAWNSPTDWRAWYDKIRSPPCLRSFYVVLVRVTVNTMICNTCYDVTMLQFSLFLGICNNHILRRILEVKSRFGPGYMCKIDTTCGFYIVWLLPADISKLGIIFPSTTREESSIGFPMALWMGWFLLPPY
jgi:hypothetical protein